MPTLAGTTLAGTTLAGTTLMGRVLGAFLLPNYAVRDGFSRDLMVDLTRGYDHIRGVGLSTSACMHLYRPSTHERTMAVGGADRHGRSHSKVSESGAVLDPIN